ncbi:type II secretion system protein GspM [Alkalinema pantanalense CENA528]|uniref:type II secretion system protein GspM n=1 Tax=Alkalinema pantanalense TaxID=1620705 RepID=UPI003D6FA3E7
MTASGDFIPQDPEFDSGPSYPSAFGITFTPTVTGVLLGIGGIVGAVLLWLNLVQPAWDQYNQLKEQVAQKQEQLKELQTIEKKLKDSKVRLAQVEQQRQQVLALFASEKNLDTILFDLSQLIEKNNRGVVNEKRAKLANCPVWVKEQYTSIASAQKFEEQFGPLVAEAKLRKFQPFVDPAQASNPAAKTAVAGVVNDGSLGEALNNKLKRSTISVEFEGNFNQTQNIFRTIERLQPLLIIRELNVKRGRGGQEPRVNRLYEVTPGDGTIKSADQIRFLTNCQPDSLVTTSFKMDALIPLTSDEAKKLAPSPSPSPAAK